MTNGTLSVLRRILDITVDSGARYDNPAKDKDVKRARVRRKELQLPEPDQFLALLDNLPSEGGNRVMVLQYNALFERFPLNLGSISI